MKVQLKNNFNIISFDYMTIWPFRRECLRNGHTVI